MAVREALEELEEDERRVVQAHYSDDESLRSISHLLERSANWAQRILPRIHRRLRDRLVSMHTLRRNPPKDATTRVNPRIPVVEDAPTATGSQTSVPSGPSREVRPLIDRRRGRQISYRKLNARPIQTPCRLPTLDSWSPGDTSEATGSFLRVSGDAKFATGSFLRVSGDAKLAAGSFLPVSVDAKFAAGSFLRVSGDAKFAAGSFSIVSRDPKFAAGSFSIVSGDAKFAAGSFSIVSGDGPEASCSLQSVSPNASRLPEACTGARPTRIARHIVSTLSIVCSTRPALADRKVTDARCIGRRPILPQRSIMNSVEISRTAALVDTILADRTESAVAYDQLLGEYRAISAPLVRAVNIDVTSAVTHVLAAVPRLIEFRAQISRDLPTVNLPYLDKLSAYASGLQEAHVRYITVGRSPDAVRALATQGDLLRTILRTDGAALVRRGLLDGATLEHCHGFNGYNNIATDLSSLATVMMANWTAIESKCGVKLEELRRAKAIAEALLTFVAARERVPELKAAALDMRARAFTLMVECYEEARRAITFLRWHEGDAEQIAPSLYAGRHHAVPEDAATADDATTTEPTAQPAAAQAPAVATPAVPEPAVPAKTRVYGPPGSPNSNPFMQ